MSDMPRVFMPIALGALVELPDDVVNDIGLIYEYLDQAGPMSVNGLPMFMSFKILNQTDATVVHEKVKAIIEALEKI